MTELGREDIRAISLVDIDQTLIEGEGGHGWMGESWLLLTAGFKAKTDAHIEIYTEFIQKVRKANGDKDMVEEAHTEMTLELINLWEESNGVPITRRRLELVCKFIATKVKEEAKKAIGELLANGVLPVIGTGGFQDSARTLANLFELQSAIEDDLDNEELDLWFGNTEFIFDGNDPDSVLVTFHHESSVIEHKRDQAKAKIQEIIETLELDDQIPVYAVGDGKSDLGVFLMERVRGVAFKPTNNDLEDVAKISVFDWASAVKFILDDLVNLEDETLGIKD